MGWDFRILESFKDKSVHLTKIVGIKKILGNLKSLSLNQGIRVSHNLALEQEFVNVQKNS